MWGLESENPFVQYENRFIQVGWARAGSWWLGRLRPCAIKGGLDAKAGVYVLCIIALDYSYIVYTSNIIGHVYIPNRALTRIYLFHSVYVKSLLFFCSWACLCWLLDPSFSNPTLPPPRGIVNVVVVVLVVVVLNQSSLCICFYCLLAQRNRTIKCELCTTNGEWEHVAFDNKYVLGRGVQTFEWKINMPSECRNKV